MLAHFQPLHTIYAPRPVDTRLCRQNYSKAFPLTATLISNGSAYIIDSQAYVVPGFFAAPLPFDLLFIPQEDLLWHKLAPRMIKAVFWSHPPSQEVPKTLPARSHV